MTMTVSCFIAPPFYREAVHGEGKHKAGLQAGTPGDESHHKEKLSMERGSTGLACRQALQVMRVHETTHKGSLSSRQPMQSKSRLIRFIEGKVKSAPSVVTVS